MKDKAWRRNFRRQLAVLFFNRLKNVFNRSGISYYVYKDLFCVKDLLVVVDAIYPLIVENISKDIDEYNINGKRLPVYIVREVICNMLKVTKSIGCNIINELECRCFLKRIDHKTIEII